MNRLDLATLRAKTQKVITTSFGDVTIRRMGRMEYGELVPGVPPEVSGPLRTGKETKEEIQQLNDALVAREAAWLKTLSPAERVARRAELLEALHMAICRAVIDPKMTIEDVRLLGDDSYVILQELQEFWRAEAKAITNGGAEREPVPDPGPAPEPDPEPVPEPARS
jgi:hypothetical protein